MVRYWAPSGQQDWLVAVTTRKLPVKQPTHAPLLATNPFGQHSIVLGQLIAPDGGVMWHTVSFTAWRPQAQNAVGLQKPLLQSLRPGQHWPLQQVPLQH
jgi:hypothetical protein